jgi:hypothetical protein
MSYIVCKQDFRTNEWDIKSIDLDTGYAEVFFQFVDGTDCVQFKDLHFGYTFYKDGQEILSEEWPMGPNSKYISSDQKHLETIMLQFEAEENYKLQVWSINDKKTSKASFHFTTGRPDQPFPSWKWNAEAKLWDPPKPHPENFDYSFYEWDEVKQEWFQVDTMNYMIDKSAVVEGE